MTLKINLKKIRGNSGKIAKKLWKNKIFQKVVFGILLAIVALAVFFFSFNLTYKDKIFPHTYIGGVDFGGATRVEAQSKLEGLISSSQDKKLDYVWEEKTYTLGLSDLGVDYEKSRDKTINQLMSVGRTGHLGKIINETFRSVVSSNTVLASFELNEQKLNEYLTNIAKDIDIQEKDATIEIRSEQLVIIPEKIGRKFEINTNRQIVFSNLGSFNFNSQLPFEVLQVVPKINSKIAQAAIAETLDLMKRNLVMKAANKTFELKPADITSMIEFIPRLSKKNVINTPQNAISIYILSPEISPVKVRETVDKIAGEVYQEPKDPKFQVTDGRVANFQLEQTGYELEKDKAVEQIIQAINNDESSLDLPVKVTEPSLSSDDPEKLGLKDLVSEGKTSWRGSPQNRIHNLSLGAEKISGTIVKPGEEFSTIKTIGVIDGTTGFLPELVIKNSTQVTPEYGGGLCQVSTTLFRAVLNAGLKVTERSAHSFRVSYYEPPVGMDATIYDPAPDFKFINNMDTPILIWAYAGNNSLTFQIYGTKDNRKVEVSDPVLYDYTSPGEAVYTQSDSMAAGAIRQVERATSGVSASFKYKVISAVGQILQDETFVSKYVPVPNTYLYGPGTEGIPGQDAAQPQVEATSAPEPAPTTPAPEDQGNIKKKN
ncbi:MAG: VanW family protein [Patescibacteria group bacterium]